MIFFTELEGREKEKKHEAKEARRHFWTIQPQLQNWNLRNSPTTVEEKRPRERSFSERLLLGHHFYEIWLVVSTHALFMALRWESNCPQVFEDSPVRSLTIRELSVCVWVTDGCIRCPWGTFDLLVQLTQTVRKPRYLMGEDILKTHLGCPSCHQMLYPFSKFSIFSKSPKIS